jgi:starch synthase (maltosyl-transferring)
MESAPREQDSEEYLDSEKYQVRHWDLDRADSLRHFLARLNEIRRTHPALQQNRTLRFHDVDNDQLVCWSKQAGDDEVLCVVNLDPWNTQSGWTSLDLGALGVPDGALFFLHDRLTDTQYEWRGAHNFVELDPRSVPAHVFTIGRGA